MHNIIRINYLIKFFLVNIIISGGFQNNMYAADVKTAADKEETLNIYYGTQHPYDLLKININRATTLLDVSKIIVKEKEYFGTLTIGCPPFNLYSPVPQYNDLACTYKNISLFYTPSVRKVSLQIDLFKKNGSTKEMNRDRKLTFDIPATISCKNFEQYAKQRLKSNNIFLCTQRAGSLYSVNGHSWSNFILVSDSDARMLDDDMLENYSGSVLKCDFELWDGYYT